MINPFFIMKESKEEFTFNNYFNEDRTIKRIKVKNLKDRDKIAAQLVRIDSNIDSILVTKDKGEIFKVLRTIIETGDALYTKEFLLEKVLYGMENTRFEFIGKVPVQIQKLNYMESKNVIPSQTNYVVGYSNQKELEEEISNLNPHVGDTMFFVNIGGEKIKSIGPMIEKNSRTDLRLLNKELTKKKRFINVKKIDAKTNVLNEYLSALVDYFTDFFSSYSAVWEREIEFKEGSLMLSERLLS